MARTVAGSLVALVIAGGLVGARVYLRMQRDEQRQHASDADSARYKARIRSILAAVQSDPRLKDAAKDLKLDATYIESIFDEVHEDAFAESSSEYVYIDAFFKKMSARAVADKKNELSGSLDKINRYAKTMGVQGSSGQKKGPG
jgi:hypothetical protein